MSDGINPDLDKALENMQKTLDQKIYPSWSPLENESIYGKIIERRQNVGVYDKHVYILEKVGTIPITIWVNKEIEQATEGTFSIWGSVNLDRMLLKIEDNEIVGIRFLGETKKGGRRFKNYRVVNSKGEEISLFEKEDEHIDEMAETIGG